MKVTQRLVAVFGSTLVVIACLLGLASQVSAVTILTEGDAFFLGSVDPDGGSEETQAEQITFLVGLAPGGTGDDGSNDYVRSANVLCSPTCPVATDVGSDKEDSSDNTLNFGDGFTYLKAKYGTHALVWYVAGLTGDFTIPTGTGDGGLSHSVLFNPGGEIPEPATLFLIGSGMVGIGYARRKGWLKSRS